MSNKEITHQIIHLLGGTPAVLAGGIMWRAVAGGCEMRMKSKRVNACVIRVVGLNVFSIDFFKYSRGAVDLMNCFGEVDALDLREVFTLETGLELSL